MIALRHVLLVIAMTMLTACGGSTLYHQQLISLNKGMSPIQASVSLDKEPVSVHTTTVDGVQYVFHRYYLHNGRFGDTYLLCFESDKLKYWGYIEEFRRYPDERINKALEAVLIEIQAAKA